MGPMGPQRGAPQPWDVGDVVRAGWEIYKTHWAPLTFGIFLTTMIGSIPGQVPSIFVQSGAVQQGSTEYWLIYAPFALVGQIIAEYFGTCMTRASLRAARENNVTFGDFFSAGGSFFSFLGMSIVRGLACVLGLLLFIIPGVILSLGFMNAGFYVVDQKMGPVESLKASWESTDGQKGSLFVYTLAELGITILGMLACCFGIFVAIPVCLLARAIIYMRMSGMGPAAGGPPPPMGGMVGVPGGGYGSPGFGGPPGYGGGPPGYGPPPGGGYGGPPGYGPR